MVVPVVGMTLGSLAAAVILWSTDELCWRTSDEVVERRVRVFNRDIADRFWAGACQELTRRARRRYAALSEGRCAHGLRAAAEQGTLRRSPVQMSSVNLLRSRATVETREHRYELTKPRTGYCIDWQIDSVTSRAR